MNLREQFEKETGELATDWRMGSPVLHPHYVKWLEQRFKEQVEVLRDTFNHIHWCNSVGCIPSLDVAKQIEEQLNKSEL